MKPLKTEEINGLSRLSFAYALFEYREGKGGGPCRLVPLDINPDYLLDESLSSLLKYTGKTNELFTRLMLRLAIAAQPPQSTHPLPSVPLRILDPLAGKGTTLFEALMHGHHAYGVEIDEKYPAEADQYLKKFLELARFKHTGHKERVGGQAPGNASAPGGKKFSATRFRVTLARDKEAQKSGDTRQFEIINGDTRYVNQYYKKDFFDAVVADLPYGVQHASKDNKKTHGGGFTRNAMGLLQEALPGWLKVLKPGGSVVLAWNLFLIPRREMEALLGAHGLSVPEPVAALDFTHRVDQAIERDVIVGMKRG
jgi:SAM-dependent methyltransferase